MFSKFPGESALVREKFQLVGHVKLASWNDIEYNFIFHPNFLYDFWS